LTFSVPCWWWQRWQSSWKICWWQLQIC
jgi:hypothetical protein